MPRRTDAKPSSASLRTPSAKGRDPLDRVRKLAMKLPEVEEATSYGTAAFKVKGKLLARMKEDGATLVLRVATELKEALITGDPDVFFTTPHYDGYPAVLVRLGAIDARGLAHVLDEAWRFVAPKKLVAARDAASR